MTDTYFKAVTPGGHDFHTGQIDYLAEGVIRHPLAGKVGDEDARYYLAAARAAARALTRDLIGTSGYTQEHYDLLTLPWRKVIGPIHPDDPDLRA